MSDDQQRQVSPRTSVPAAAARGKVIVVMPAYNAARTLERTYREIPAGSYDGIILVDDASSDDTVLIARELNLMVEVHPVNQGYGGNQKTCYSRALREGADVIVMLHPDNQYDPSIVPELVAPIVAGEADVVLASRMLGSPLKGGMPRYKYAANRLLTTLENAVLGTRFSEFHTGSGDHAVCPRFVVGRIHPQLRVWTGYPEDTCQVFSACEGNSPRSSLQLVLPLSGDEFSRYFGYFPGFSA
jgi:glycosyltransferase involved in cell wall biosynthesis